jgi:tetratricopeptide (TPR) repeat protein
MADEKENTVDISHLFLQANQAYKDSDFSKAAEYYESIISNGIVNGEIFYNLGNAHAKNGKIGKALLNYRKAEMLLPRDEDIQTNLQYTLGLVRDRIECKEFFNFLKSFCFWYSKLNINELVTVFLIVNFIFWIFLTIAIFYKSEIITVTIYIVFFLTLVFGVSSGIKIYNYHFINEGIVAGKEILVRSGNSVNDTVLFKLHEGAEFRWLDEQSEWVKICLCDGKKGWVQQSVVLKIIL